MTKVINIGSRYLWRSAAGVPTPMLYVSIVIELLRSRPALTVCLAALAQGLLWTMVPSVFYSAPPGDLPLVLAIGREFQLGSYLGPPLAFWLAELAFDLAGRNLFGVYLLSQACVVVTYYAVFLLGRSIVGAQHAALAALLMVGIAAFTVPTPDFGPFVLAMPLWAIVLLHYWRAVGEGKRAFWLPLAIEIGLLLMTSYIGVILLVLLVLFTVVNANARGVLKSYDPLIAACVAVLVAAPHIIWLAQAGREILHVPIGLRTPSAMLESLAGWGRQIGLIFAAHAGLVVLVALVAGWPWPRGEPAPVIVRQRVGAFGRQFVLFFALAPALAGSLLGVIIGIQGWIAGVAPLIILSGLAIVIIAGDEITLVRQHILIAAWLGLLLVPPIMAAGATLVLPWLGVDLRVGQPVQAMARFFSESFQRRTGSPLHIVGGDTRTAALIALGAPTRPDLFINAAPRHSPWVTGDTIRSKGAIMVWPTTDTGGTPPAWLKEQFPDLVPEVPRVFERRVQGRLPLLRIGWAVIRGQAQDTPAPAENK